MNWLTEHKIELYRRGNFELLGLFQKQLEALNYLTNDDTVIEVLYGGAARGGKTWLLCLWKILQRLAWHGSTGLIGREDKGVLKLTTMETYKMVLDDLQLIEGVDYQFVKNNCYFENGSTELFSGIRYYPQKDPEFNWLGSFDLTDAALDESQQIHYKATQVLKGRYSKLKGRNTYQKNGIKTFEDWELRPKAFYGCNPMKNWVYLEFYKLDKLNRIEPHKKFIKALPKDNPHVAQSYFDSLETADKITRQRLLLGNFEYDDNPDALVEYDAIIDCFTNDHIEEDYSDAGITADLAMKGRDRFVCLPWRGYVCDFSKAVIENESTGKGIEDAIKKMKVRLGVRNSRIIADSDGLGSYLSSYIENIKEFRGGASPFDPKFGNLKDECAFKLAELIKEGRLRIICEKKELREDIAEEIEASLVRVPTKDVEKYRVRTKNDVKEIIKRSPDFYDALLMRMLHFVSPEFDAML